MRNAARRIRWDMRSMFHSDSDERLAVGLDVLRGSCGVCHRVCLQAESKGHKSLMLRQWLIPQGAARFNRPPVSYSRRCRERTHVSPNRGADRPYRRARVVGIDHSTTRHGFPRGPTGNVHPRLGPVYSTN